MITLAKETHCLITSSGRIIGLPTDKPVFFGRSEGNLIRVSDPCVSRQHAEMYWDGAGYVLNDLCSGNGTWVNGNRVETHDLMDKDVIQIGEEHFVYRIATAEELRQIGLTLRSKNARHDTRLIPGCQDKDNGERLTGSIEAFGFADLVQLLNSSKRTGLLVARGQTYKAMLYFFKGEISEARFFAGGKEVVLGDEAVFESIRQKEGAFTFNPGTQGVSDNVEHQVSFLLFEAMRQMDENRATS